MEGFDPDDIGSDDDIPFDVASFCQAEKIIASKECPHSLIPAGYMDAPHCAVQFCAAAEYNSTPCYRV